MLNAHGLYGRAYTGARECSNVEGTQSAVQQRVLDPAVRRAMSRLDRQLSIGSWIGGLMLTAIMVAVPAC